MAEQHVITKRYALERSVILSPDDVRLSHPATVSVIGNEPVAEFESLLGGLNDDGNRFATSEYFKSAATWKKWGNFKMPTGL